MAACWGWPTRTILIMKYFDELKRSMEMPAAHSGTLFIGSVRPLHPHHQHTGDYTEAFTSMCKNIDVIRLDEPEDIFPAYTKALWREDGKSTILVEWGDYYSEK